MSRNYHVLIDDGRVDEQIPQKIRPLRRGRVIVSPLIRIDEDQYYRRRGSPSKRPEKKTTLSRLERLLLDDKLKDMPSPSGDVLSNSLRSDKRTRILQFAAWLILRCSKALSPTSLSISEHDMIAAMLVIADAESGLGEFLVNKKRGSSSKGYFGFIDTTYAAQLKRGANLVISCLRNPGAEIAGWMARFNHLDNITYFVNNRERPNVNLGDGIAFLGQLNAILIAIGKSTPSQRSAVYRSADESGRLTPGEKFQVLATFLHINGLAALSTIEESAHPYRMLSDLEAFRTIRPRIGELLAAWGNGLERGDLTDPPGKRFFLRVYNNYMKSLTGLPLALEPVGSYITSKFGMRHASKGTNVKTRLHKGIDLSAKTPRAIFAPFDGTVSEWREQLPEAVGAGKYMIIESDDGSRVRLFHLSERLTPPGKRFWKGQIIAITGKTGTFSKDTPHGVPHLHLEYFPPGAPTQSDPLESGYQWQKIIL